MAMITKYRMLPMMGGRMRIKAFSRWIAIVAVALGVMPAMGQDLALTTEEKAAPAEVSEAIRGVLGKEAVILGKDSGPVWEFWFVNKVALPYAPDEGKSALEVLKKTALLGVVTVHEEVRDFKDNIIEKGTYTLRYGQQPTDGNHLGTSTHNHFAVLIPVKYDTEVEAAWDHEAMADESLQSSVAEHPMNLNLQPVKGDGDTPALGEGDDDSKLVKVTLAGEADGAAVPIRIGVVYEGHGHI